MPATPGHCVQNTDPTPQSRTFGTGWDVVPATLVSYGSIPDVTAAFHTYVGSHTHLGPPYEAPLGPQPPDQTLKLFWVCRKVGVLTWFPLYPRAPVVPPTSRRQVQHVVGVTQVVAQLTMLTYAPISLPQLRTTLCRGANSGF